MAAPGTFSLLPHRLASSTDMFRVLIRWITRNCALRGFSGGSGTGVAESKLLLVTIAQDNKLREELLGEGRATLFQKPADQEDG